MPIQNHIEIQSTFSGPNIVQVAGPFLVWFLRCEVPIQPVWRNAEFVVTVVCHLVFRGSDNGYAVLVHQSASHCPAGVCRVCCRDPSLVVVGHSRGVKTTRDWRSIAYAYSIMRPPFFPLQKLLGEIYRSMRRQLHLNALDEQRQGFVNQECPLPDYPAAPHLYSSHQG